jgi:type I restriction enzyme R subunit
MTAFTESTVESAALAWLEAIGWRIARGPDIAPDMLAAERAGYGEVALSQRLRDAVARLNPDLSTETLENAFRKLTRSELPAAPPATALAAVRRRGVPWEVGQ